MAKFNYTIKWEDAFERRTTRGGQVQAVDFAAAEALVSAFQVASLNISLGNVVSFAVARETPIISIAGAGASVAENVSFSCAIGGLAQKRGTIKLPMPDPAVLSSTGAVLMTDASVLAWIATVEGNKILISDGEVVDKVLSGQLDR